MYKTSCNRISQKAQQCINNVMSGIGGTKRNVGKK